MTAKENDLLYERQKFTTGYAMQDFKKGQRQKGNIRSLCLSCTCFVHKIWKKFRKLSLFMGTPLFYKNF